MQTKVTTYRIIHEFNQDGKLDVAHIYYVQCKVLFFWHTIGSAGTEATAIQEMLLHDTMTKDFGFFERLLEVWGSKFLWL